MSDRSRYDLESQRSSIYLSAAWLISEKGQGPEAVAAYRPSEESRKRVWDLVAREKSAELTADEAAELDHYLQLEHIMRLAKARARQHAVMTAS